MGLQPFLLLSSALFCIGLFGVVTRRNTIGILLGIELMINSVNINLVVFLTFYGPSHVPVSHGELVITTPPDEGKVVHDQPGPHSTHLHDPHVPMLLPLLALAALSLLVGIYSTLIGPLLPEAAEPVGRVLSEPPVWLTPSAVGVAVVGILLAWMTYQRRAINPESLAASFGPIRTAARAKFWVDDVFVFLYGRVLLGISRVVGWTDRYIVDGVLNVVSAWTLTAGDDLRTIQTGKAQDYVYGVAVGVLALILWMKLS